MDCDVLICGLGPVGLLSALLLAGHGVRTIALDEADGPHDLPRAAVIDDEVLRIMQSAGVDQAVLAQAQAHEQASYVTATGHPVAIQRLAGRPLGQPPLVSIHQPTMERTLVDALAGSSAVDLRWSARLEGIDDRHDHVVARVRPSTDAGGAATTVTARWVVGCDGANSLVRRQAGIAFTGSTFAQRWLVVDARVDRPLERVPHPSFVGDAERPTVSLPMSPGRHRWEWMLHPGEDEAALLQDAWIQARIQPWLAGEHATVERALVYTFHARTAARWRAGRVLLAGDAAHVMPPFAGQGFGSGARDAANLAWKLQAVLGGAGEPLLDTYEAERRPHVRAMQQLAVRWGAVVQSSAPAAVAARDAFMDAVDGTALQDWLLTHAKPLPTYREGCFARRPARLPPRRVVGALFPQPRVEHAGVRCLLDDALGTGWAALSRDGNATGILRRAGLTVRALGNEVQDVDGAIGAWLDARGADWVLLRPDRFVFDCGRVADVGRTLTALRAWFGADAP